MVYVQGQVNQTKMALSFHSGGLPSEGWKKTEKKAIAKKMKMESKTYTHSRCGKCNRFGHTHDKCATTTRRTIPKSVTRHMQPNEKKSYEEGMKNTEYGKKYL